MAKEILKADEEIQLNLQAEPIYDIPHKYAQGTDSPVWKKKQFGNKKKNQDSEESVDSMSISDDDSLSCDEDEEED